MLRCPSKHIPGFHSISQLSINNDTICEAVFLDVVMALVIGLYRFLMNSRSWLPLGVFGSGLRMFMTTNSNGELTRKSRRCRRRFCDGLFQGHCQNLSHSCKRHLPGAVDSIRIALSQTYAFHPDVSPTLDNVSDIIGVVLEM